MATIKKLSFKEACEKTGNDFVKSLPYSKPANQEEEAWNALKRLQIYAQAYNMVRGKKWKADYANDDQPKWRVWLKYDTSLSAFVFVHTNYDCTYALSATGSRHAFRTDEIAEHVGRAHIDEWNKWLITQQ